MKSHVIFCIFALLIVICLATIEIDPISTEEFFRTPSVHKATIVIDGSGEYKVMHGIHNEKNAVAWATYNYSTPQTGWDILDLHTTDDHKYSDEQKMYAAGFLEGYLTRRVIYYYYVDMWQESIGNLTDQQLAPLFKWVEQNDYWVRRQIAGRKSKEPFWNQVGLIYSQLEGLVDAATIYALPNETVSRTDILMINLNGDLFDLIPGLTGLNPLVLADRRPKVGHCTGFVKFAENELFTSHNTWDSYNTMVRIYKNYYFPTTNHHVKTRKFSFSSYPGTLSSVDDFYIMDSGLSVIETTNNNYNMSLYTKLKIECLASWVRAITANRLAGHSKQWTELYARYNSGTYNNQWIVVDYNKYHKGMKALAPDTVWIIEQIPGYTESGDVTDFVNHNGYWASYNVPYFKYIFDIMNYPMAVKKWGNEFSWSDCSRANIFRRDQSKVKTIDDMRKIMRYNGWKTDPLSSGDPCNSICARCDLSPFASDVDNSGCLDAKITSSEWHPHFKAAIIAGPTTDQNPPFRWNPSKWQDTAHLGQPNVFDFKWEENRPKNVH